VVERLLAGGAECLVQLRDHGQEPGPVAGRKPFERAVEHGRDLGATAQDPRLPLRGGDMQDGTAVGRVCPSLDEPGGDQPASGDSSV